VWPGNTIHCAKCWIGKARHWCAWTIKKWMYLVLSMLRFTWLWRGLVFSYLSQWITRASLCQCVGGIPKFYHKRALKTRWSHRTCELDYIEIRQVYTCQCIRHAWFDFRMIGFPNHSAWFVYEKNVWQWQHVSPFTVELPIDVPLSVSHVAGNDHAH
jgi:hypothetical protein